MELHPRGHYITQKPLRHAVADCYGSFCHAVKIWTGPLGGTSGVFLTVDILSAFGKAVGGEVCELWFGSEVTEARKRERTSGPTAKRPTGGSAREGLSLGFSRLRTVPTVMAATVMAAAGMSPA